MRRVLALWRDAPYYLAAYNSITKSANNKLYLRSRGRDITLCVRNEHYIRAAVWRGGI